MNDGFKQRLVGAIVLICLALILWPVLFGDSAGPMVDRRSQIPPMPEFEKYEVARPQRPEGVVPAPDPSAPARDTAAVKADPAPERQSQPAEPEPTPPAEPDSGPALDQQGLPRGWVLQVASFSREQNARDLSAELKKMGYKAFTREVDAGDGQVVRVYIGPKLSREAFAGAKSQIDKKFGVESLVVEFEQ